MNKLLFAFLPALQGTLLLHGAEALTAQTTSQPCEYTISHRGKPVMVYSFAPTQYKPYIKALHTLRGDNVLRDAPFDHLHHHALMYGIKVNGLNFWEETSGSGIQRTAQIAPPVIEQNSDGLPQATINQIVHWVAPADAFLPLTNSPALLIERRTLRLTVDERSSEVSLRWQCVFEVGTKTNTVVLSGANYHGLGVRFLKELDPVALHFSPIGKTALEGNRQDVSQLAWEAVSFTGPNVSATFALFGHPKNARGHARFFAMRTPFAYLSATQGLDAEPLVYRRGESFELNYLITLYPNPQTAEFLSRRAARWESDFQ